MIQHSREDCVTCNVLQSLKILLKLVCWWHYTKFNVRITPRWITCIILESQSRCLEKVTIENSKIKSTLVWVPLEPDFVSFLQISSLHKVLIPASNENITLWRRPSLEYEFVWRHGVHIPKLNWNSFFSQNRIFGINAHHWQNQVFHQICSQQESTHVSKIALFEGFFYLPWAFIVIQYGRTGPLTLFWDVIMANLLFRFWPPFPITWRSRCIRGLRFVATSAGLTVKTAWKW